MLLGDVRISLCTSERHDCEQKHSSMPLWVSGQLHAPAVLLLEKESPEYVMQRLGGKPSRSGQFRGDNKLMHVPRFELRTLSLVDRGIVTILTELTQFLLSPSRKHVFKV